jgi:heptosyltransferase-2
VRLPNPVGDVVLATPALRALRAALPAARIVWSGRPPALALLDGLPERDAVHEIAPDLDGAWSGPARLGRAWRDLGADAVLLLPGSRSSAKAAAASGAAVRAGYATHGRASGLTHAWPSPTTDARRAPVPMRAWYLGLVAPFGARDDGQGLRLATTPAGEAAALARLARAGLREGAFFAVNPGAAFGPSKVYPPRLLSTAVARVREATGLVPLVLCGPGEEALAAQVAALVGPPVASTDAEVARLPELKSLLARAALCVTTDTGPRHVAAAFRVPTVVLIGPTDPTWGAGDDATATVVRVDGLWCLGCHLRTCPVGHPCMERLDPAAVAEACVARARDGGRGVPARAAR